MVTESSKFSRKAPLNLITESKPLISYIRHKHNTHRLLTAIAVDACTFLYSCQETLQEQA
jgi:hypothetical protein